MLLFKERSKIKMASPKEIIEQIRQEYTGENLGLTIQEEKEKFADKYKERLNQALEIISHDL